MIRPGTLQDVVVYASVLFFLGGSAAGLPAETAQEAEPASHEIAAAREYSADQVARLLLGAPHDPSSDFVLVGEDAGHQLVVNAELTDGRVVDVTRQVQYLAEPAGIVEITSSGWVVPKQEGQATITARLNGEDQAVRGVTVTHMAGPPAVNFPHQIVPIFTKYGCNGVGCHG
jgi:hypothetical protein